MEETREELEPLPLRFCFSIDGIVVRGCDYASAIFRIRPSKSLPAPDAVSDSRRGVRNSPLNFTIACFGLALAQIG